LNLQISRIDFVANLIVLESKGIDLILGVDWLMETHEGLNPDLLVEMEYNSIGKES
jgi:hypothetical protein